MHRASRLRLLVLLAIVGALVPRAVVTHLPTACPIRRMTGYPCPTCGMVRSWHSLARMEPMRALRDHPFGPIALAAMTAEVWRPGILDRAVGRARSLPEPVQAVSLVAWLGWWGSRLVATWRARRG